MHTQEEKQNAFGQLLNIMDDLRAKCPWDQKQTWESLRHLTIEELYELSDAILENNPKEVQKEIGDVLLHLVFYAKIASESKLFDIKNVIDSLNEKLIFRHPHIYGDTKVENEDDVKRNWEQLKLKEGNQSVLSGVPRSLPAMIKAYRIQEKVKGVGFEFQNAAETWEKVQEELQEFHLETETEKREQEFGDVLFSLINYARFTGINPEDALEKTNKKFIKRFQAIETVANEQGKNIAELSLTEQDELWNLVKKKEKQ